ncbi:hypothetical protein MTO96_028905 [Rhipicephalus appendiculatus]
MRTDLVQERSTCYGTTAGSIGRWATADNLGRGLRELLDGDELDLLPSANALERVYVEVERGTSTSHSFLAVLVTRFPNLKRLHVHELRRDDCCYDEAEQLAHRIASCGAVLTYSTDGDIPPRSTTKTSRRASIHALGHGEQTLALAGRDDDENLAHCPNCSVGLILQPNDLYGPAIRNWKYVLRRLTLYNVKLLEPLHPFACAFNVRLERLESAAVGKPPVHTETPGEASRQEEFILGGAEEHIAGAEERIAFASVATQTEESQTSGPCSLFLSVSSGGSGSTQCPGYVHL